MIYEAYCEEHDLNLVNGHCGKCRDEHGSTFPLDMQSTYLKEKKVRHVLVCKCLYSPNWEIGRDGDTHFLRCMTCGYELSVKIALPHEAEIHWRRHER